MPQRYLKPALILNSSFTPFPKEMCSSHILYHTNSEHHNPPGKLSVILVFPLPNTSSNESLNKSYLTP